MATQMKPPQGVKPFNNRRRIRKTFGNSGEVV